MTYNECWNFNIKISDVCKHVPMKEGGMISVQEEKEKLIRNVKRSVKHLMEESVTKKVDSDDVYCWCFIHSVISRVLPSSPAMWAPSAVLWIIVSSSVRPQDSLPLLTNQNTSLGLRRRSLGLFKTNSSSALLNKISKECAEAFHILKRYSQSNSRSKRRNKAHQFLTTCNCE